MESDDDDIDLDINIEGEELPVTSGAEVSEVSDDFEEEGETEDEDLDIDEIDFKGLGDILNDDALPTEDGDMDFLDDILSSDLDEVFSGDDLDE